MGRSRNGIECEVLIVNLLGYRVGVFATLTNSYALVATGGSMNFYRYGSKPEGRGGSHDG